QTGRTGLTDHASAAGVDVEIVSVHHLRGLQWLQDNVLQRNAREVIFEIAAVDVDLAAAGGHPNTSDRSFSATGSDKFLCLSHSNESGELDRFRLLRAVRVGFAAINFELSINRTTKPVMRNHSTDGALYQ